ncbi:putative RNA-directed DNA polymerase [Lupinus albus]|uniref:Putative RNA-directed DNA polymerase n=1 Tax=Lupinus albus TaxID=3870 RepID=A0A6A4R0G4_LUPAL|nr:putative RNA-directed DNA polymerase [Lupinus albus]
MLTHQRKYIHDVLVKFKMLNCNATETPTEVNLKLDRAENEDAVDNTLYRQMVGFLRFVCHTRPEISYSVGLVSRFMNDPRKPHLVAAKRILRYLKGTNRFGVLFTNQTSNCSLQLVAYSDSDWSGDMLERKSTLGYVFMLYGFLISWCSKRQEVHVKHYG